MSPLSATVVVVGAAGEVGRSVLAALGDSSELRLIAVDVGSEQMRRTCDRSKGDVWLSGDITDPSEELRFAIAVADAVVLAVPEGVAEAAAPRLFDDMAPGSLIVDTLSVKDQWFDSIAGLEASIEVLSINPMFAPSLGFEGRPVAVVELRSGPRSRWFMELLEGFGCSIVPVGAEEHDRITASVQVATHAAVLTFGLAIETLGHDVERLAPLFTPPHRTMVALLARICAGDGHVYHDIQHHNPHAAAAREAIAAGLIELSAVSADPMSGRFSEMTRRLRAVLGNRAVDYEELCAQMFAEAPVDADLTTQRSRRPCAYRRW